MFCAIQYVAIHSYIGFTALVMLIIIHDKSTALAYAMYSYKIKLNNYVCLPSALIVYGSGALLNNKH